MSSRWHPALRRLPAGALASAYSQDGVTCRDFLASYVQNGSESWLQGAACRTERGKWEVRNLRPWTKT
jgi:surface antigen